MTPTAMDRQLFSVLLYLTAMVIAGYGLKMAGPKGGPSDLWLLKGTMASSKAHSLVSKFGFRIVSENGPGFYVLTPTSTPITAISTSELKQRMTAVEPQIEDLRQLFYKNHVTKGVTQQRRRLVENGITDSAYPDMWHVSETQYPNIGVHGAWMRGYSGSGVHVSVLDDGVEPDHPDLITNYVSCFHSHGTWCAGIVSAEMNDDCVLGMAYQSTFSSVKIFDSFFGLTDYGESLALTHNLELTDIYSNSWGPVDSGDVFSAPEELTAAALKEATTMGRNGKGAIFTWAAGNGGDDDDCNCDGYAASIYTISVTAIGPDQGKSWYSEECSSIFIGAYSGDSPDLRIATTDISHGCTTRFQGTSASCPMGAGIIALALEANPDLTWRDVQHLIVETATTKGLIMGNWHRNAANKLVSNAYGFGILNADAMVQRALTWENVPAQEICQSSMMNVNRISNNGDVIEAVFQTDGCGLHHVEHVEVWADFGAGPRGSLQITLTSPGGTTSRLLRPRRFDLSPDTTQWTFMTVHSWGESPVGTWTLKLEVTHSSIVFRLNAWRITMYGTRTLPASLAGEQPTEDDDSNLAAIVGGSVGGAVGLGLVVGGVYYFVTRPKVAPA